MDRLFSAKTKNEKVVKLIVFILAGIFIDIICSVNGFKMFSAGRIVTNINMGSGAKVMGEFMLSLMLFAICIFVTIFCINAVIKLAKFKVAGGEELSKTPTQVATDTAVVQTLQTVETTAESHGEESCANRRVDSSGPVVLSKTMDALCKTLAERKDSFINAVNFKTLQKEFIEYSARCGLSLTGEIVIDLLSSLSSSRLLIFNGEKAVCNRLSQILGGFFGFRSFNQENASQIQNLDGLFFDENLRSETNVALGLYSAYIRKDALNFISFDGVELSGVDKYLKRIQPYFKAPLVSFMVNIDIQNRLSELSGLEKGSIVMPQNVWFILNKNGSDVLPYIYAKYSAEINLEGASLINSESFIIEKQPCYSVSAIMSEVDKLNAIGGLDLDNWKKIDQIEEHLKGLVSFSFDNRSFTQFERYLAVMIELTNDQNRAIDKLLCYRVLQIVACYSKTKIKSSEVKLDQVIYSALGEGNCNLSLKALSNFDLI